MVQTHTQNYAPTLPDFTKSKEPRHVVLDSVETVDISATKILSPDNFSTKDFDFALNYPSTLPSLYRERKEREMSHWLLHQIHLN